MLRIAKFEKVSPQRFVNDWIATFPQQTIEQAVLAYEHIQLPRRATSGSAGYDFFAPVGFELPAGGSIKIPTGVRALIEDGWVLTLYPRSGLGFKFRFQLSNFSINIITVRNHFIIIFFVIMHKHFYVTSIVIFTIVNNLVTCIGYDIADDFNNTK